MKLDYQNNRKKLLDWTKEQLTGFSFEDDTMIDQYPLDRFFIGLLFPINEEEGVDETDQDKNINENENIAKQVVKTKRYVPPSSAGFSFFVSGDDISLRIAYKAVYYEAGPKGKGGYIKSWTRRSFTQDGDFEEVEFSPDSKSPIYIFNKKAKIDTLWREYQDGFIVTITLSNNQSSENCSNGLQENIEKNKNTLFEVEFKCIIESGNINTYPQKDVALLNDEEKEIELRYQDLYINAVGHGVAVDWKKNQQDKMEIWSDFMPIVEVPQVTADTGKENDRVLSFLFLQDQGSVKVIDSLNAFVDGYEHWIKKQESRSKNEKDQKTARNIIINLNTAKKRMLAGVKLLEVNKNSRTAFSIMNKAMLMQWVSSDKNNNKDIDESSYRWRPFQLAFILMTLESTINENSEYRETLDLIWFPTGGGKTEAYLGLMSFLFVYRRLKYTDKSNGTVSIMRYTLRLLTSQQFVRANKVIFALELIRQKNEGLFGAKPFTSGLWVGSAISPNTLYQVGKIIEDKKYSKLALRSCPWCNDKFSDKNYVLTGQNFYFRCINSNCDFGKNQNNILPCNVVDEVLYMNPPTLLISTVDKFARLAWEERAGAFLGKDGNRPPELIIQDELHLISGELGSIVGLYEVGIETALILKGMHAKYIASTATIKNAKKQVQTLYAKDANIFPASGLRYNDSYFAKTVSLKDLPGRLYVGYLAYLLSRQDCLRPLTSILLAAPIKLFKEEEYLDSWWTQVIYHSSLKGVANSRTLYQSGVSDFLKKLIIENLKNDIENELPNFTKDNSFKSINDFLKINGDKYPEIRKIVNQYLPIREVDIKVLSSQNSADENAVIFENLSKHRYENNSIDVALATTMISVGLDVSRLALMIINGQPLTTAEYIQTSSRVGRGTVPGIVFTNYYKTQARSLSHYENFRSYHDSFYRFVEPSSLTPFTYQARERALHAALIIAIRYGSKKFVKNDGASKFDKNDNIVRDIISEMKIRCNLAIGPNQEVRDSVAQHIDKLATKWHFEKEYSESSKRTLVYNSDDKSFDNLICNFDKENGVWKTLQSMRNVENSALIKLLSGVKKL